MRAVVFDGPGRVRVAEVPDPSLRAPGDAIVRVLRTAICGSDLHFLHAKAPIEPGDVLGHEAVGVVEAVGDGVRRFRPGDRVVVAFDIACGACWFCERGQTSLCEDFMNLGAGAFGGGLPGAQAEHVRIPVADVNLLAVPDDVDDEHALFVGDVADDGAVRRRARIDRTRHVGGRARRRSRRVLRDPGGAEPRGAPCSGSIGSRPGSRSPPPPAPSRSTPPRCTRRWRWRSARATEAPDVVIEAVGTPEAYETAVEMVRRGGRGRRRRHVRGRIGRGPARGVLGARAHRPVRRHLPGARVVGAGDAGGPGRAAGSGAADQPSSAAGRGAARATRCSTAVRPRRCSCCRERHVPARRSGRSGGDRRRPPGGEPRARPGAPQAAPGRGVGPAGASTRASA